jgi:aminopeptidase
MDPRYIQLAQQLVRYSTALKKGEKILLDLVDTPEDMAVALFAKFVCEKGCRFCVLDQTV